jgi:hypothetical protein
MDKVDNNVMTHFPMWEQSWLAIKLTRFTSDCVQPYREQALLLQKPRYLVGPALAGKRPGQTLNFYQQKYRLPG